MRKVKPSIAAAATGCEAPRPAILPRFLSVLARGQEQRASQWIYSTVTMMDWSRQLLSHSCLRQQVVGDLAEAGRVISFDRPGFGKTERVMPPRGLPWRLCPQTLGENPYSADFTSKILFGLLDRCAQRSVPAAKPYRGTLHCVPVLRQAQDYCSYAERELYVQYCTSKWRAFVRKVRGSTTLLLGGVSDINHCCGYSRSAQRVLARRLAFPQLFSFVHRET